MVRSGWLLVWFLLGSFLLGSSACSPLRVLHLPDEFRGVPGDDPAADRRLRSAQDLYEREDQRAALETAERILAEHPEHVPTHRLRQTILMERGRRGLVLHEAEARVERDPENPRWHYLAGRLQESDEAKQRAFIKARDLDPGFYWAWYGLAYTLRDSQPRAANEIYEYLYAKSGGDVGTAVAYAASLWRSNENARAGEIYEELGKARPGLGNQGLAATLLRSGMRNKAWPHLLRALELRPFDVTVRNMIGSMLSQGLSDESTAEILDSLTADQQRLDAFARGGDSLLAALFEASGDPLAAVELLGRSARLSAPDRRRYRRCLLSLGEVRTFLADVRAARVHELDQDEGNQVRARWLSLYGGDWMSAVDPLADPEQALALARALVEVGYLEFAERVAGLGLRRHPDRSAELALLREAVRKELAFQSGLRRILTRGYLHFQRTGKTGDLKEMLDACRRLSQKVLGEDVVGEVETFEVPFVGTLVDSLGPGLPRHLARYNKHLVIGQRADGPVEGMLLTRLCLRKVAPVPELPLPPRTVEVVGENRQVAPLEQADLAGIALLNHYVVDMDEVRAWAGTILRRRDIARADDEAMLRDPLPEQVSDLEPADAAWRLALLSPLPDAAVESAILDIIRWHERGHMVDFLYYLPVTLHPLRSLALAIRNGFSAVQIGGEMEARAELAALAMSEHTCLVLAHIAGFLVEEAHESWHAVGFRSLASAIIRELERLQAGPAAARYWHLQDPQTVREIARKLLRELW